MAKTDVDVFQIMTSTVDVFQKPPPSLLDTFVEVLLMSFATRMVVMLSTVTALVHPRARRPLSPARSSHMHEIRLLPSCVRALAVSTSSSADVGGQRQIRKEFTSMALPLLLVSLSSPILSLIDGACCWW